MTHGGKRSRAGRKPIADKAQMVTIYPRSSQIKKIGGIEKARELALKAIIMAAEKVS